MVFIIEIFNQRSQLLVNMNCSFGANTFTQEALANSQTVNLVYKFK